jgi:hypothetical protein
MMLDHAIAAAERTEAARFLITRAEVENVDLVLLSALQLCVLDGPRQPMFEERVAHAWTQLGDRRRRKIMEEVSAGLVKRGLLIDDRPGPATGRPGADYGLKPELGLMLAARFRPTFIVVAAGERPGVRPLSLFALGDQAQPVRGIVAEVPAGLPADRAAAYPDDRKLGPLGWIYRYVLVSTASAADLLARWTITPPTEAGEVIPTRYRVSAYRPDRENPVGYHLGVRGDGLRATVDGLVTGNGQPAVTEYDLAGLRGIMLQLLTEASP